MAVDKKQENIEYIEKALASAYWRGRLDHIRRSVLENGTFEIMIDAAAEQDKGSWFAKAKIIESKLID